MPVALAQFAVRFGTSGARGLVSDFTDDYCWAFTSAFLRVLDHRTDSLLVGHDLRPSSPLIAAACMAAAEQMGVAVRFAGAVPTPALAFAAREMQVPAIMVTGSHIPADRNGLKAFTPEGEITKAHEQAMREMMLGDPPPLAFKPGRCSGPDILTHYVERYTRAFASDALGGMRIGVYEHSTVARDVLHKLLRSLGAETIGLGRSATFRALDTEALQREDHELASTWAALHRLDAIASADGDADRPLLGDEHGDWLRGDVLGLLAARELGARTVVTPLTSSTALEKSGLFPSVIRTRIGSPYVVAAMERARDASPAVGFEANGGFLLGSDVDIGGRILTALPTRDALLPILLALVSARQMRKSLSQLVQTLPPRRTHSDRLTGVPATRSQALIGSLAQDHDLLCQVLAPQCGRPVLVDRADGLRATFDTGDIVHIRPSGNAPELRCYAESGTQETARALCRGALERARFRICSPEKIDIDDHPWDSIGPAR